METQQKDNLSRGQFLRSLGMSSSALMAFYCMGTLTSCSSENDDPTPAGTGGTTSGITGTTSGTIDYVIDLTADSYKKLKNEGEFSIIGDTIVIALSNQRYVALSKACTHEGTAVTYRKAQNDLRCPNHGSEFSLDGSVKLSPAASPLTVYKTTLSSDGNKLTVKV